MHSIRKFVGRGTIAIGLAALVALAVSVQTGEAAKSTHGTAVTSVVQPQSHDEGGVLPLHVTTVAPSAQCTAALSAVRTAFVNDRAEDNLENANASPDTETGADATEDASEAAAMKAAFTTAANACGGSLHKVQAPPTPATPACTAAWNNLKAAFAADKAEDQAELANGTEGTAADVAEDKAEFAAKAKLWSAIKSACGTTSFFTWQHR
ncbi:MAG TPA: hypothetical protein VFL29_14920 [Candidatus Dormibacteraeota bacterium]|nr:hypothetical protein [Candidatus Dormibacteraeota bacterium]